MTHCSGPRNTATCADHSAEHSGYIPFPQCPSDSPQRTWEPEERRTIGQPTAVPLWQPTASAGGHWSHRQSDGCSTGGSTPSAAEAAGGGGGRRHSPALRRDALSTRSRGSTTTERYPLHPVSSFRDQPSSGDATGLSHPPFRLLVSADSHVPLVSPYVFSAGGFLKGLVGWIAFPGPTLDFLAP